MTLDEIHRRMLDHSIKMKFDIKLEFFQSNSEGEIVDCIQKSKSMLNGIIINAGAYLIHL